MPPKPRMLQSGGVRALFALGALTLVVALGIWGTKAEGKKGENPAGGEIKHVFVIALENHNWTQPATVPGGSEQIYQNPNAPFINSLVNGTALAFIDRRIENISKQVAYATAYHNVLATKSGNNLHIHPSEPSYIWAEAGTNFGVFNDDDPYKDNRPNAQTTTQHLTGLLQKAGKTWKSYQEDIDLTTNFERTSSPICPSPRICGPFPWSGYPRQIWSSAATRTPTTIRSQYNYEPKHNPPRVLRRYQRRQQH